MKKQQLKQKVLKILLEIHRGFLTKEQSDQVTDEEVLANIPQHKITYIHRPNDTSEARVSPFTYRWVKQRVKKDPTVSSEVLLREAGFK